MEFETWWLLGVPLFFALGWIAARIDIRHVINESRSLPNNYYKGLNALLDEDPDKAIEIFEEIPKFLQEAKYLFNQLEQRYNNKM